ncbi:hypothetical protein WBG78_26030 [Chryseolinea sp. T2]
MAKQDPKPSGKAPEKFTNVDRPETRKTIPDFKLTPPPPPPPPKTEGSK